MLATSTCSPRRCSSTAARSPAAPLPTTSVPQVMSGRSTPPMASRVSARPHGGTLGIGTSVNASRMSCGTGTLTVVSLRARWSPRQCRAPWAQSTIDRPCGERRSATCPIRSRARSAPVAEHWVHNLSPFIVGPFDIGPFHDLGLRWYGLAYLAGLACGYWLVRRWCDAGRAPLRKEEIQDFVLYSGMGMIIGGRVGYCLLYGWHELVAHPLYLSKITQGGMASHGGIIGLVAGMAWFARHAGHQA